MADSERQEQVVAMTLAALLEELKEVDAEQSEKLQCWIGRTRQVMNLEMPLECDLAQALIQNSIQRACERREWTWCIYKQTPEEKNSHYADISKIVSGYDGDYWHEDHESCITWEDANSPAEALLAAYVAAVKKEEKR